MIDMKKRLLYGASKAVLLDQNPSQVDMKRAILGHGVRAFEQKFGEIKTSFPRVKPVGEK